MTHKLPKMGAELASKFKHIKEVKKWKHLPGQSQEAFFTWVPHLEHGVHGA